MAAWSASSVYPFVVSLVFMFDRTLDSPLSTDGALLGIGGIAAALTRADSLAGTLTAVLLVLPTWAFLSAPWNSLAARRTARPVHAPTTVESR